MKKYTFTNGDVITSELSLDEVVKRSNRLDTLRVMTEDHDEGEGKSICTKALKAFNKTEGFTGIIHLTSSEKDWLSYKLESDFIDDEDREVINFYIRK